MALITVGGEHIFSVVSFHCPCSRQNFAYGMTFLLGPAAVLLILGLFFSTRLWWIYTECFNRKKQCKWEWEDCTIFVRASVVPIIWLCAALLNGTFYECAASGLKGYCVNKTQDCHRELAKLPCDKSNGNSTGQLLMFRAHSQMMGWWVIIVAAAVGVMVICCSNFCSKESYPECTFKQRYAEKLKEHLDAFAVDYASRLAKSKLQSFFDNNKPDPFDDPREWEDISPYSRLIGGDTGPEKQRTINTENLGQDNKMFEKSTYPENLGRDNEMSETST